MGFDAWGARRNGESNNLSDWGALTDSARLSAITGSLMLAGFSQPVTTRGYTGHEMVDDMGIIHMNGRIYDARLARFLQADPIIQAATNTQSYNRYSYVWNNPLNATDPSGFVLKKYWDKIRPYVGAIVAIVAGYFLCQNTCTVEIYAAIGAVSGAAGAAANGGNIAMGFVLGAFSGIAANYGVIAAGVAGGFASYATGGKFGHGFASAGLGTIYGGAGQRIGGWQGLAASAVIGGSISEATGGKFKNGAASAAFSYAVSWGASKIGKGGVQNDDTSNQEPEHISDFFQGNQRIKSRFKEIVHADGTIEHIFDLRYENQSSIDDAVVDAWAKRIEADFSKQFGLKNKLTVVMTKLTDCDIMCRAVGAEIIFDSVSRAGCPPDAAACAGVGSGRIRFVTELYAAGRFRVDTASHEFAHAIGFNHDSNSTHSIRSYADNRSLTVKDYQMLVRYYGN